MTDDVNIPRYESVPKELADEIEKLQSKLAIERERFIKIVADQTDAEGLCSADDILRALGDEK